jgi:type IV secretion system protein VirB9
MKNILAILIYCLISLSAQAEYNKPVVIDSRIKTFIYNENEVFAVTLHYGYQSHIDFAKGEEPIEISLGDSSSWKINKSGRSLFISPQESNAHTNMTIITNKKRIYEFDLFSKKPTDKADKDLAYVVRFYYPEEPIDIAEVKLSPPTQMLYHSKQDISLEDTIMAKKNRNYSFKGDEEIAPISVFDDGKLTYMKFRDEIPEISLPSSSKKQEDLQILSYKDYIIVNKVVHKLILRHQDKTLELYNENKGY